MKTRGGIIVSEKENVLFIELKENIKDKFNGKSLQNKPKEMIPDWDDGYTKGFDLIITQCTHVLHCHIVPTYIYIYHHYTSLEIQISKPTQSGSS